jgi:thiamine biosynthesis protein ThiI
LTYDKENIVQQAREIGTYEISIEPYKDCCSIFQRNPRTNSDHHHLSAIEKEIFPDYDQLIDRTLADMFWITYRIGKD